MQEITFNDLPEAMSYVIRKVDQIADILIKDIPESSGKLCMNLDEFREYHPNHPSAATVYTWVSKKQVPYHKQGKSLYFIKSEIDEWLVGNRYKTVDELRSEAHSYCKSHKK